ncbi:MAG: S24/S26 family peptidase [Fibrobacter sp.]|nr:S24/S26 family peptidase [Fibrobacter sp.]
MSVAANKDDGVVLAEAIRLVNEGVEVIFPVNGRSMRPFIEGGRDSVLLVKPQDVKPMDVVLACVGENHYVVHRIISVDGERVTLMGDGNLQGREFCECKEIYAKVTHVVSPNGKRHALNTPFIHFVQKMWVKVLPLRKYLLKLYRVYMRLRNFKKEVHDAH